MKIDLLHYSVPPIVGGVETIVAQHAALMADAGHVVRVLAGRGEQFDERIPLVRLPLADSRHAEVLQVKGHLDKGTIPEEFEALSTRLYADLKEITSGTQVLIAHNVCSLNKNLALTAALHRLSQEADAPRFILWHHDLAWTTSRYRAELHDGYPWDILRTDWHTVKQVVVSALRQGELSDLLGVPAERIHVVPNGISLQRFLKLEPKTVEIVRRFNLWDAAPLLLLPVRITPRKNIELALRMLKSLRQHFPGAALVVTGPLGAHNPANAAYFDRLRELRDQFGLNAAAHFLAELNEFLPDVVIADLFRLADGLFLPSREEGFGIPVVEAGASGTPIFCTDLPPLRELAGEHALYFDPDAEPESLATRIFHALDSSPVYAMRVRVRKQYTWEKIYAVHIDPLLRSIEGG